MAAHAQGKLALRGYRLDRVRPFIPGPPAVPLVARRFDPIEAVARAACQQRNRRLRSGSTAARSPSKVKGGLATMSPQPLRRSGSIGPLDHELDAHQLRRPHRQPDAAWKRATRLRVLDRVPDEIDAGCEPLQSLREAVGSCARTRSVSSNGGSISTTPRRSLGGSSDLSATQASSAITFTLRSDPMAALRRGTVLRMQLVGDQHVLRTHERAARWQGCRDSGRGPRCHSPGARHRGRARGGAPRRAAAEQRRAR